MHIFVEKNVFSNQLKLFQGIFEKKNILEILQNIKITAHESGLLELVATDLEIGLTSTFSVDVKESGTFTVNGKDFYELISKMNDGVVEISEANDLQVVITNERKTSKYKLLALQSSDYPSLPLADFSNSFKISMQKMYSLINKVYYVVSPEMKFNLGGALLKFENNKIEMAATDGHRLSYSFTLHNFNLEQSTEYIISRKTLLELLRIGESSDGDLEFSFDKNNIFFKFKHLILSSRIIDQKFPNYKSVIPERTEINTILNREDLIQILRRVMIFKTRNNGVYFKFSNSRLALERNTPEKGEAYDEIEINYDFKPITVAFNGNFILDFLTHIDSEKVRISINESENSFVFQPLLDDNVEKFFYVVMPLNI